MSESPILMVGTGAMASLFAAMLSAKGLEVRMLGTWQENIKALEEDGVRFIDRQGKKTNFPVIVSNDPEKFIDSPLAIVLVKSYQTSSAAERLGKCLAEDGLVLTLQNGLGNEEILADKLGAQRVITGVTTLGATLIEPGTVRMGGAGSITISDHDKAEFPAGIFRQAGLEVNIVADTSSLMWGKLVINASINPLTGLLSLKNGDLLKNPFALELMEVITEESAEIAREFGVELPYPDPVEMVEAVARKTAENYSSMYNDIHRGSPTEIDAINGAIVRVGEDVKMPTPYNRMLWMMVKAVSEN